MSADNKPKVLVVDDSDLVAAMVGEALTQAGMDVVRASDGADGIMMAYREIPDVIVMDAEMPRMQGHLASRVLKSRRGIGDIPIIMHTSLSEDKDKYWALASGTDEFAIKDFDNIGLLVDRVRDLADHPPVDAALIREDSAGINVDRVFEMTGQVLDQQLFLSTINNLLARVGRSMDSLADTARQVLELLPKVCENNIAVLILTYGKTPKAYILPCWKMRKPVADEFLKVCLGDFHPHFPSLDPRSLQVETFGLDICPDYDAADTLPRINSYRMVGLFGRGDQMVGTLHLGSIANNHFSEAVNSRIEHFARNAGPILDNSIMYNRSMEMQGRIRSAFAKFVPPEIIEDLIESTVDDDAQLKGENREVCILFTDIRSFTTISEANRPEQVVDFLNRYFSIMVALIRGHGGTVDKFIGDAILAIFGAPTSYEDNALRAVRAAIDMREALASVPCDGMVMPKEGLRTGIGIHNGQATVGNIGSRDKFNYTVIGDAVNLASRLEGLTKHYKQEIIISEAVQEKLGNAIPLWELDTVKVRGKEVATRIFGVVTDPKSCTEAFLQEFSKALRMYRMGNFSTAQEYFLKAHQMKPGDHMCRVFVARCKNYLANPPADWDGAQVMDSK